MLQFVTGPANSGKTMYLHYLAAKEFLKGSPVLIFDPLHVTPARHFRDRCLRSISSLVFDPDKSFGRFMEDIEGGIPTLIAQEYFRNKAGWSRASDYVQIQGNEKTETIETISSIITHPRGNKTFKVFLDNLYLLDNKQRDLRVSADTFKHFYDLSSSLDIYASFDMLTPRLPEFVKVFNTASTYISLEKKNNYCAFEVLNV